MALIKKNGQLFEDTDDTLMGRVNQLGTTTPTSPAGAAGIGASPDSAKMVGSGAQRQNALKQATAPKEQTLAGQQRLAGPAQATTADQQAQMKAAQLSQLGSMGMRVQNKIEGMIAQSTQGLQTGTVGTQEGAIQSAMGWTNEQMPMMQNDLAAIDTAIQSYMANPNEQALAQLVNMGMPKLKVYELTGMTESGAQATGQTIAQAMGDEFIIKDLDVSGMGIADHQELADMLGLPLAEVQNMTVPQFQETIRNIQSAEFDRIQELRAQLAGLPSGSARAQQLRSELQSLGDVGMTGAEAAVAEAADSIDMADQVEFGGQTMEISELLKDDTISQMIEDYIASNAEGKEELFPAAQYGELRQWIEDNQQAIAQVKDAATNTQMQFQEANDYWDREVKDFGISDDVLQMFGWNPSQTVTSQDVQDWKTNFETTGIGQLTQDKNNFALLRSLTPETAQIFQTEDWSSDEIKQSYELADDLIGDPTLAALSGLSGTDGFITDQNAMDTAMDLAPVARAIDGLGADGQLILNNPGAMNDIKVGVISADWLQPAYADAIVDDDVRSLIVSGTITAANRDSLDWSNLESYRNENANIEAMSSAYNSADPTASDIDAMLDGLFGAETDLNKTDIEDAISKLELDATLGVPGAAEQIARYKALLDPQQLYNQATQGKSIMDYLQGTNTPKMSAPTPYIPNARTMLLHNAMEDGQLTASEILQTPGLLNNILTNNIDISKLGGPKIWQQVADQQIKEAMPAEIKKMKSKFTLKDRVKDSPAEVKEYLNDRYAELAQLKDANPYPTGSVPYQIYNNQVQAQKSAVSSAWNKEYNKYKNTRLALKEVAKRDKELAELRKSLMMPDFSSSTQEFKDAQRQRLLDRVQILASKPDHEIYSEYNADPEYY